MHEYIISTCTLIVSRRVVYTEEKNKTHSLRILRTMRDMYQDNREGVSQQHHPAHPRSRKCKTQLSSVWRWDSQGKITDIRYSWLRESKLFKHTLQMVFVWGSHEYTETKGFVEEEYCWRGIPTIPAGAPTHRALTPMSSKIWSTATVREEHCGNDENSSVAKLHRRAHGSDHPKLLQTNVVGRCNTSVVSLEFGRVTQEFSQKSSTYDFPPP